MSWIRKWSVSLGGNNPFPPDIRVRFSCRYHQAGTPDVCDFNVTNPDPTLAKQIVQQVAKAINGQSLNFQLSAGYEDTGIGLLFNGPCQGARMGKENPTDSFLEIYAAANGAMATSGDAYRFGQVNTTLSKNHTAYDQLKSVVKAMPGIQLGNIPQQVVQTLQQITYPRGVVLYGQATKHLRRIASLAAANPHYNPLKPDTLDIVPVNASENASSSGGIDVNWHTGMIARPEQTTYGIIVRTLINPSITVGSTIHINNDDILTAAPVLTGVAGNLPGGAPQGTQTLLAAIVASGNYYVMAMDINGDSKTGPWEQILTCNGVGVSATADANQMWPENRPTKQ